MQQLNTHIANTTPTITTPTISSSAVLIDLSISVWTGRKQDKTAKNQVESNNNTARGVVTVNNLVAGNYVAEMTFGVAPNTYTATDYFTVAGGNAVFANLSASANTVDMAANTTVQFTATAQGATGFNWNFGDGTIIIKQTTL